MKKNLMVASISALSIVFTAHDVFSADEYEADIAQRLANPVANLISVPLQYNYDENIGPAGDGSISRLNIQPVIPFSLNEDWNLITRTIIPVLDLDDIPVKGEGESGLSDVLASQFFSPSKPTSGGWIWGAGPVMLLPTATDEALGTEKWGMGPTAVALKQEGRWTVGMLFNHVWSFAGESDRADVNNTLLQPFTSYITPTMTTISLNTDSTYDWEIEAWSVPVNFTVAQLLKVRGQIFQVAVGARYWADSPDNGPEDWGVRATLTFLFPQ